MNIDRQLVDSIILGLLVWFLRRDIVLALVIAIVSYVLKMIHF